MKRTAIILGVITACLSSLTAAAAGFTDVNGGTPYARSIMWMADNGVISGDAGAGTFRPDDCTNRAEFLKMLFRAHDKSPLKSLTAPFSDLDQGAWYYPYVATAFWTEVIDGYPDRTFRPEDCVNRMEALKMAILEFSDGVKPVVLDSLDGEYKDEWFYHYLNFTKFARLDFAEIDYDIAGKMTRKEVAELLFRVKAAFDNASNSSDFSTYYYSKELMPLSLNDEVEFSNFKHDYSFTYDGEDLLSGDAGLGYSYYPENSDRVYLYLLDSGSQISFTVLNKENAYIYKDLIGKDLEDFVNGIWEYNTDSSNSPSTDIILSQVFEEEFDGITWLGFRIEGAFGYTEFGQLLEEPQIFYFAKRGGDYFQVRTDRVLKLQVEGILEGFEF